MSRADSDNDDRVSTRHPKDVVRKTFDAINDRPVDDISLEFFYQVSVFSTFFSFVT